MPRQRIPQTRRDRLAAVLETARLSNAPTCATNVLAGAALGAAALPWAAALGAAACVVLLYAAGMLVNGAIDADRDRVWRPERAIPQGRLSAEAAYRIAFVAVGLALAGLALAGDAALGWGLALVACILGYNLLHAVAPAAIVGMALCRALVYPLAAAAVGGASLDPRLGGAAAVLGGYTAAVTLVARGESGGGPSAGRFAALAWPLAPLAAPLFLPAPAGWPAWAALAAAVGWAALAAVRALRGRATREAVMAALAGIALFDATVLSLLGMPLAAAVAALGFLATVLAQRRIAGT